MASDFTDWGGSAYTSNALGLIEMCFGIEFLTLDSWYSISAPPIRSALDDHAVKYLSKIPPFHENPMHMSDIWNAVKNVGKFTLHAAPKAWSVFKAIEPILAAL